MCLAFQMVCFCYVNLSCISSTTAGRTQMQYIESKLDNPDYLDSLTFLSTYSTYPRSVPRYSTRKKLYSSCSLVIKPNILQLDLPTTKVGKKSRHCRSKIDSTRHIRSLSSCSFHLGGSLPNLIGCY